MNCWWETLLHGVGPAGALSITHSAHLSCSGQTQHTIHNSSSLCGSCAGGCPGDKYLCSGHKDSTCEPCSPGCLVAGCLLLASQVLITLPAITCFSEFLWVYGI